MSSTDSELRLEVIKAVCFKPSIVGHIEQFENIEKLIAQKVAEAEQRGRINSLLDLEQWIKLHDLQQEMVLDGIEHMVKSILQVPDQRFQNHDDRIKELKGKE